MANFTSVPIIRPYTYRTNPGPGCERGQPYWASGNQHNQIDYVREMDGVFEKDGYFPENYQLGYDQRTQLNLAHKSPCTLYTYSAPESHRSCKVSINKDGSTFMNSKSCVFKIGSKHTQDWIAQSPIKMFQAYLEKQNRISCNNLLSNNGNIYNLKYPKVHDEYSQRSSNSTATPPMISTPTSSNSRGSWNSASSSARRRARSLQEQYKNSVENNRALSNMDVFSAKTKWPGAHEIYPTTSIEAQQIGTINDPFVNNTMSINRSGKGLYYTQAPPDYILTPQDTQRLFGAPPVQLGHNQNLGPIRNDNNNYSARSSGNGNSARSYSSSARIQMSNSGRRMMEC